MKERFVNPPLVEIVAELRWNTSNDQVAPGVPAPILPFQTKPLEGYFSQLGAALGKLGFHNSERLVPSDFPWMPFEPIVRYRHTSFGEASGDLRASTLFQIGAGLFSANAVPPYTSWDEFGPIVREGVEAFLGTEMPSTRPERLTPSLRYINAFRQEYTRGMRLKDFLSEVMGIKVELPGCLSASDTQLPFFQITRALPFGNLALHFFEGSVAGGPALIWDMTVNFSEPIQFEVEEIMSAFSSARNEIHKVFVELTKPIHSTMTLKGDEE